MVKILVVDDDINILTLISDILVNAGHKVVTARSADEALASINGSISVLICDIIMPEQTGLELISKLREKDSNLGIIAISGGISGKLSDHYLKSAKVFGANKVLPKPFSNAELISAVNQLLSGVNISERSK